MSRVRIVPKNDEIEPINHNRITKVDLDEKTGYVKVEQDTGKVWYYNLTEIFSIREV